MKNWKIGSKVSVNIDKNEGLVYSGIVTDVFELSENQKDFIYEVTTEAGVFKFNSNGNLIS